MEPATAPPTVERIEIARLDRTRPVRASDPAHIDVLADVLDDCPPILVQAETLRVVDGHMRVSAAELQGRTTLPVRWVHGSEARLVEVAAAANSTHGLPLTALQRKAAARRLLELAPAWSNRRVARACGLSEASVRRLRCPPASPVHLDTRVGLDGKTYPVTAAAQQAARELLTRDPQASDRAIARAAGLSPTTVGRLRRDEPRDPPHPHVHPHPHPRSPRWPWAQRWLHVVRWLVAFIERARALRRG